MYFDVSMEITETMQVFQNQENIKPKFLNVANYANESYFESAVNLNCHTGTHIDAPMHMIENGKNLSSIKIEDLVRSVKVLDLSNVNEAIEIKDLKGFGICKNDFILIKTRNSFEDFFNEEYIALSTKAAEYLAEQNISGIGIDGLSIGAGEENIYTHKALLKNDIIIIEGLRLKDISEGLYNMIALPLKINTLEGCPMRVILTD